MIKIKYFKKNNGNVSINFIDEKENFVGCDLNYVHDDYCIFLVPIDVSKKYKEIYDLRNLEEEKRYEEILEKSIVTIDNFLEFEKRLEGISILNGNINEFPEGVCYFELTNNMSILFISSEVDEFSKEMYSCYNEVLTVFNKIENKKKI